tara:strand:- start:2267 stop:2644 length:378 start_codon:yes stop_codon:yes gene_type:complete
MYVGLVSGTTNVTLPVNNGDWYLEDVLICVDNNHDAHAADIWTFDCLLVEGGDSGSSVFSTTKSTVTSGTPGALLDYQWVSLRPDQNQSLDSTDGDATLRFSITKSASAVNLTGFTVVFVVRRQL